MKLSPSAAEWKVMEAHRHLPRIESLIGMTPAQLEVAKNCNLTTLQINQDICSASDEGQPTLLCGIFTNHVVEEANTALAGKICKFEIFPSLELFHNGAGKELIKRLCVTVVGESILIRASTPIT